MIFFILFNRFRAEFIFCSNINLSFVQTKKNKPNYEVFSRFFQKVMIFDNVFRLVTNIILRNQRVLYDRGQIFEFFFQTSKVVNIYNPKHTENAVFLHLPIFCQKIIDILFGLILSSLRKQQHLLSFSTAIAHLRISTTVKPSASNHLLFSKVSCLHGVSFLQDVFLSNSHPDSCRYCRNCMNAVDTLNI